MSGLKGIVDPNGNVHHFDHEYLEGNPAIPAVDSTLTQEGAAADAKKTGDEIAELKSSLTSDFLLNSMPENRPSFLAPYLARQTHKHTKLLSGSGFGELLAMWRWVTQFFTVCSCVCLRYVLQFSRKVSQPEEGKNHSSAKLAVILSDCTEIATGDAASLRYGI